MLELSHILGQSKDVNVAEMSARAVIVFVYGLLVVRFSGRRVFGHWSALDIVVSIIVGSNLSRALTGSSAMLPTLAATTVVLVLHWVLAMGVSRSNPLAGLIEGRTVHLVKDGKVDEGARRRCAVSWSDLHEALRQEGVEDIAGCRLVTLEPSGKISVLKR